jgi:hypothetical protein
VTHIEKDKKEEKDKNLYRIFDFWNSLAIITHKDIKGFDSCINKALKEHSEEEIMKAMENYSKIIRSDIHYFNYRWTLDDFLTGKKGSRLIRFMCVNRPFETFLTGGMSSLPNNRNADGTMRVAL